MFEYESIINSEKYMIMAYPIESVLSEKIETIFSKMEITSRAKDFYDIYMIYNFYFDKININSLKKSIDQTFKNRKFIGDLDDRIVVLKDSSKLKSIWGSYVKKNSYAKDIKYEDTIICLEKIISLIKK